ncbi:MAG TPA: hypothetical protein VF272_00125, partial [Candidatus Saccharimonadia bacterium]
FKNWRLLKVVQPHSKTDHLAYLFLATDFESQTDPKPDPGEKIIVHLKTLDELKQMLNLANTRYLPQDILARVATIEQLEALPAYDPSA